MLRSLLLFAAAASGAIAQTLTVDYPDSVLGTPAGQYPIYTGTGTNLIRTQCLCPATFAGLPTQPMVVTRVGVQLAEVTGPILYAQFVVRVGRTSLGALTNTWNTNLPDQTIQVDLSNTVIAGGPNANIWVEWPLAAPFLLQPGEGVVLDITSQASTGGQYLRTAIGTGVARLVATAYAGGPTGPTLATSGGIKFRLVFENGGLVSTGAGCPGSGNFVPAIGGNGDPTIGNLAYELTLQNALGGTAAGLLLGFPTQLDLGAGCIVRSSGSAFVLAGTLGSGPGQGTALYPFPVPPLPWLLGVSFDAQWAVLDPGSGSPFGAATSSSARMVFY
jgi:hypothetical protein